MKEFIATWRILQYAAATATKLHLPISFSQAIDFLLLSLLLQNTLKLFHSKVKLPNATRHNKGSQTP
ncbi:hypothetical protein EB796_006521 [Bugula neritina]|uniref:Uncharacterized protein n=1 Tax=Bugula neritina TaxID=10212 RepID=A0A7J7KB68_BUGNE|nr:hypothetical protein EB796_006521 [Bugula neritina]